MKFKPISKKYISGFIYFSICILITDLACEKNKLPFNNSSQPQITLSLDREPYPKEIRLKLELKNIDLPVQYQIKRDNKLISSGQLAIADTIFKDDGLTPAKQYNYQAFVFKDGSIAAASNILKATTMDTTTHNYVWTVDTIGLYGSRLYDVFAISEDDVWAVGEIEMGEIDLYNAVHWDGQDWEITQITFTGWCSAVEFPPLKAIFTFSENDIWYARAGSLVHFDGNIYFNDCDMNGLLDGSINKIWGSNSNNLLIIGNSGTIVHHKNNVWQKIESGTQIRLTDIWGLSENDIYIVGADMSTLDNVVLHYDGTTWNHLPTDQNRKVGVWGTAPDHLFFTGDGVRTYDGEDYHQINWPSNIPHIFSQAVRGSAANNVFVAGDFGLVLHFNGATWKGFPELINLTGTTLKSVSVIGNSVFIVGRIDYNGIIFHGRRID